MALHQNELLVLCIRQLLPPVLPGLACRVRADLGPRPATALARALHHTRGPALQPVTRAAVMPEVMLRDEGGGVAVSVRGRGVGARGRSHEGDVAQQGTEGGQRAGDDAGAGLDDGPEGDVGEAVEVVVRVVIVEEVAQADDGGGAGAVGPGESLPVSRQVPMDCLFF